MIYLKLTDNQRDNIKTPLDILDILYDSRKNSNTIVSTYYDKDCSYIQCRDYARRSFDDLLEITNTYLPEATKEDLFNAIIEKKLYFYWCSDIHRIVFHCNHYAVLATKDRIINYLKAEAYTNEIKNQPTQEFLNFLKNIP